MGFALTLLTVATGCCDDTVAPSVIALSDDGRQLTLEFRLCNPSPFDIRVEETEDAVTLVLDIGEETSDDDCGSFKDVPLSSPLGDRRVLIDGPDGPREVTVAR